MAMAPIVFQAEGGTITPSAVNTNTTTTRTVTPANPEPDGTMRPGYSGTGYLDWGDDPGDRVSYSVTVPTAGTYNLAIRYASQTASGQPARALNLIVNGGAASLTDFPATGSNANTSTAGFNNWGSITKAVALQAGANTIAFTIPAGRTNGPNFDRLEVTQPTAADTTADADGNLALSGPGGSVQAGTLSFTAAGMDADIVKVEISFDGGAKTVVQPNASGVFTANASALGPGAHTAALTVTDAVGNTAQATTPLTIAGAPQSGTITVEAEGFTITDTDGDSTPRNPQIKEPTATASNSGPGKEFTAQGLRPGFEGTGYLDLGNDVGDKASFTVNVVEAGTYQMVIRYANGGTGDRPMLVTVGGSSQTVSFPSTGSVPATAWANWQDVTVNVTLTAGSNTISLANTIANAPNIDNVTLVPSAGPVDPRDEIYFEPVVKINFQPPTGQTFQGLPSGYQTPAGFVADTGAAYGARGNGRNFGWVTETSVADGTANGTTASALPTNAMWFKGDVAGATNLQKTYAHFEYPGAGASGARAWEMAVQNGSYLVKVAIGDTAGAFDSTYRLNIEGQSAMPQWVPANPPGGSTAGGGFRSTLVTKAVTVTDGRLTLDSIGGTNTEIQWLEVERIADLMPSDSRPAHQDYSFFTQPVADSLENGQVSIAIGANGKLPTGIDPTSTLVVGVTLQGADNRGPNITHTENVKLVETQTGAEVTVAVQISGGADTLNVRPIDALKPFTSYTLKIEDVLDLGSLSNANAPLRQMQDLTTSFVTGAMPVIEPKEVGFDTTTLLNGFADNAGGFTSVEFGRDGKLYVATITGEIHRWTVNDNGTIDKASRETLTLDYLNAAGGERRGIVGFTFDPVDAGTIWITDNAPIPRESTAFNTPDYSGRVSKITLGDGLSFTGATVEPYITGLPRSGGDHVTNSLEFRANPQAGVGGAPDYLLYLSQGSNSAGGQPDNAWGNRPERLLNGAILEIDPSRDAPAAGFNVQTEPGGSTPTYRAPSGFNGNGTYPGFYNPFASDAVLKIYATGTRNAYDLVWHSNGNLYVPTNGTAAGAKTPADPSQAGLDTTIDNSPKQFDYLFDVEKGKYYGHPNPLRGEYVLNGGNPTAGVDLNEVTAGMDDDAATDGYPVGVKPDPDYDAGGTYNLGYNRSPNGAIEYTGNAFGPALKGALLFAQFSVGDNVRMIQLDAAGKVVGDDVLRRPNGAVINSFIDPLDIVENPLTGQLYLITLNRSTGASQLVLMNPAPGGVIADTTADEGGDLALSAVSLSNRAAAVFQIAGLDADITAVRVSFNNQPEITVTPDAQNRFTANLSGLPNGAVTARLTVVDDALNTASKNLNFNLTGGTTYAPLLTVQAEDRTPNDGTAVAIPTSGGQIVIRDAQNRETGVTATGMVNGLWTGAYGTDGNTNHTDAVPGGYADFGSTNADFLTFSFNVADAGAGLLRFRYASASGNRPLGVEVNGASVGTQAFAPTGSFYNWATVEVGAQLKAGLNTVTLRSTANTGPNIDQLEVLTTGQGTLPTPNANADIAVQSLDPAYFDDRLHFSWLENAVMSGQADRDMKESAFVRITNTGSATLQLATHTVEGPFELANPAALQGKTLAAGASINVEVLFDRSQYTPPTSNIDATSTVFEGSLKITTNDAEDPISEVDLAGFWQSRWEGGQEPNVNEIWRVFGFGNRIEGLKLTGGGENSTLSTKDVFAQTDETEVLSPYWKIADGVTSARITQIGAFHGPGGATMGIHNVDTKSGTINFWNHQGNDNQRFLPNVTNETTYATRVFTRDTIPDGWKGEDVFGVSVAGLSTDPRLNPVGGQVVQNAQQGHTVKVFQALDANGNEIQNVFLGIMDYTGINYDYNDNLFVLEGVTPMGFGTGMAATSAVALATAESADALSPITATMADEFIF